MPFRGRKGGVDTASFGAIMERGAFLSAPHFAFRYLPLPSPLLAPSAAGSNEGGLLSRISCAAPKKAFPKAVSRTRVRRRGRAIVAKLLPKLEKPIMGVLVARSGVESAPFAILEAEVADLLKKARLLV